ncbi:MAG: bifunctional 4-hydroxy-2-oxoglutarate aldolase/2-dehydro-3-deoxy-phosphogluconate aldolase [Acidimicrobiales bacterium]|jgi:2-dehydro-3-deoxyphosphogluconate aldolase/(4S)-4-hydroxy-2-oxoglutarate aldolase
MGSDLAPSVAEDLARVRELGILPVVELVDLKQAEPLFEALTAGGLPAAEITLRTAAGLDAIRVLVEAYPKGFIGAGTVRTKEDAARVIDAGARFVVCPGTDPEIVSFCSQKGALVMPGVCTPSEIQAALRAGAAPLLKFFPAEASGGISFLKALAGPFGEVRFVPTGGINAANLASYLSLPQVAACGGSWMVTKALLAEGDFGRVQELTAEAVGIVAAARHHG